ncbi:MAG: hypothetical protein MUF38_10670 [Anaerolineae bacterium]|nr:hypothetical protein [Anaerolineae bacterium]
MARWFLLVGLGFSIVFTSPSAAQPACEGIELGATVMNLASVSVELTCAFGRSEAGNEPVPTDKYLVVMTGRTLNATGTTITLYDTDFVLIVNGRQHTASPYWMERVARESGSPSYPRANNVFEGRPYRLDTDEVEEGIILAFEVERALFNGAAELPAQLGFYHSGRLPEIQRVGLILRPAPPPVRLLEVLEGEIAPPPANTQAVAVPTATITPTPRPSLLPTPTLIATLPIGNNNPSVPIGTNDIVLDAGNVRIHVQQIISPPTIGSEGPDIGYELLAFELMAYNFNEQPITLYQDQYTLSFPDNDRIPSVVLDRNRSHAYASTMGRGLKAPDFGAAFTNRLEIPSQRFAPVALVFQVPAGTTNLYLNIKFPNEEVQTRSLLIEPGSFDGGVVRAINEGNPYDPNFTAYTILDYEIGETEVILGAEKIDEEVESNCGNDAPRVIEVVTQEAYAFSSSRTITNLSIGPRVDVNISGEDLLQIVVMPSRALTAFLNILTFSLDVESSRESTQEFISESTQKTETITIPPNYELVITELNSRAQTPIKAAVWIAGYTYDVNYTVPGTLQINQPRIRPCSG